MIFTSYFANYRKLQGCFKVSIARYTPGYMSDINYCAVNDFPTIAPSKTLLSQIKNKQINEEVYTNMYLSSLVTTFDPIFFLNRIQAMALPGQDIVLLCYEKPGDFCHRHLLAKYLNNAIAAYNLSCGEITELT